MTRASPRALRPRSITLDRTEQNILDTLAQDCSDYHGWAIGGAAVLRALLRLTKHGAIDRSLVRAETGAELQSGRRWGGQKPHRKGRKST